MGNLIKYRKKNQIPYTIISVTAFHYIYPFYRNILYVDNTFRLLISKSSSLQRGLLALRKISSIGVALVTKPGARPTKDISIEFEIRWKFKTL